MQDDTPLPYGLSWWLDVVTDLSWEGLVADDYRVVMPLPKLTRFGVLPITGRPPYTQQLGPFGNLQTGDVRTLLSAVPKTFQIALPLRPSITTRQVPDRYRQRRRVNYVIDLSGPFEVTKRGFPKTLQSLLRKTQALDNLQPMESKEFIALSQEWLGDRPGMSSKHFRYLRGLIDAATQKDMGACFQLRENGEQLAAGFFPTLNGRTINIASVSTALGRKRCGMSRLLSLVMRQNSEVPGAMFDFEGSELPGVKQYFAKFGSVNEGYLLLEEKAFGLL